MDKYKHTNTLAKIRISFKLMNFSLILFIFLLQSKKLFCGYFDSLKKQILNQDASLIDISDYYNLSLVLTSDKKIYEGIPPSLKSEISSKIISISSAVTYNKNYILMACTEDSLLSKINLETGLETSLVSYEEFNIPNRTCSISTKNNYVYIGVSHIIIPTFKIKKPFITQKNKNNISDLNLEIKNETNILLSKISDTACSSCSDLIIPNEEDNYIYFYDYNNTYLQNSAIKIKLINNEENEGPIIDEGFKIRKFIFEFKHKNFEKMPISSPFSCEILDVNENSSEEQRLICGYIIANSTSLYLLNVTVINSNFDGIEDEKKVRDVKIMPYLRLQRINSTYIRYIFTKYSYEISLKKEGSKYKIIASSNNSPFYSFSCSTDLFFYNNHYLFSASYSTIYIKKNMTNNYITVSDEGKSIEKLLGYYEYERDILLLIYQYNSKIIKYFTIENTSYLFDFKTETKIIEVTSNTTSFFNVSELIISPKDHQLLLSEKSLQYYISTTNYNTTYDKYTFNQKSQILNIEGSLNDWINIDFYYDGNTSPLSTAFFLHNCKVTIRTCLFKCGHCFSNFSICDYGTCKSNFSLFKESNDTECYPNDQNFPYYIYNKTNDFFEKCYNSCIFCSLTGELSTKKSQHCKVCKEGYLRSYTFMGNCYEIEYPYNTSNYSKIIRNIEGEYEIIESCFNLGKYKINNTGECVDSCPLNSNFYTYYKNESLDFSKQEESFIGLLYPLNKEKPPKFLFNKVCYNTCPNLTYEDNNNKVCKCKFGWHYNSTTKETICYDNMDYCLFLNYYYHTDDKECVLNGCKDGYYQMNFECYKDECPQNTKQILSNEKKCESNLKYCIIDEHYQTQCRNSPYNGYNLRYNETKTYFQSCNESIYYFNVKTYLYKNICYEYCPEETTKNETNDRCSCNYYIYYVNEEKSDYECLKEKEKCWDKKRYNITEEKECVKAKVECIERGYKVFNDECLLECPENSEEKNDNGICLCKYYYYNDSNFLTCFENENTCESEGYPIKMSNSSECFKNKFECIKRGFKFYENICYEICPENTIDKFNDGICSCLYNYLNNSDILTCFNEDENCEIKGYDFTNIDSNECFTSLNDCINRDLKIFNNNCYNKCPTNTKPKNDDDSYCICSGYFYTDDDNKLNCFSSDKTCKTGSTEYIYTNLENKECFKTGEKCINLGLKIFNNECYLNICPTNTEDKNNNNICLCTSFSLIDEEGLLRCFSSEVNCASQGYYFNKDTKECFLLNEKCLENNKKIFGKECVNICPLNSKIKENPNICECENYFYNDNGILKCFNSDKTCESEGYSINSDTKECLTSINDCFAKKYLYYFNNTCYKESCPSGTIPLNSITDIEKKVALINSLNLESSLSKKLCICDTDKTYHGWINEDNSNPSVQKCLYKCPTNYDLDSTTKKCYFSCDYEKDYFFNDICYKNNCPEGTKLDESNLGSRTCVCEDITEVGNNSGFITCKDIYPELYYKNREKCPYFYKKNCYMKCPDNTCLTTKNQDLAKCVDVRPNMKIYNDVCIEGINELLENLGDEDLMPNFTPSGVSVNIFSSDESMDNLISKYPNLTFVNLGECKNKIKESYNLPQDTILYILGIDIPSLNGNSSVNIFNYEIYLKNGTQLKNISACNEVDITISSNIQNLDLVHFYKAIEFYDEGYDIYNRSNIFYVDYCSPAKDNGNDITLEDRAKYYYPNVSICNEGCIYYSIDFNNQRFYCECNANLSEKVYKNEDYNTSEKIDNSNYFDYFLSLINYRIFLCSNLFLQFKSFYYNAGFYISFFVMLICIILSILFWIIGIKSIRVIIYRNYPTKQKLKEILKKFKEYRKKRENEVQRPNKRSKSYKNRTNNRNSRTNLIEIKNNNAPPKYKNILKLKEYSKYFRNNLNKQEEENEEDNFTTFLKNNIKIYGENKNNKNTQNEKEKIMQKDKTNKISKSGTIDFSSSNDNIQNVDAFGDKEDSEKKNPILENPDDITQIKEKENSYQKVKKNRKKKHKSFNIIPKIKSSEKIDNLEFIKRKKSKYKTSKIKNKKNNINQTQNEIEKERKKENESHIYINSQKRIKEDLELKIDFNFDHLIDIKDDEVEKRELNNIPYRQALRIDKRSFYEILISVLCNQIEIISLFVYKNPFSHYTLIISIYLFELLLDLTMNCFLYTDDVVSEKYHNNGELSMFTSLSLSFISNIISSIIVFIISKLTNYPEIIEAIINNVKYEKRYIDNIVRLFKYIKLRLGIFYFLQLSLFLVMTYYLFIFCTVYHQSQGSIMVNYIVGACTSLAISVGLTIIITLLRKIGLKYHYYQIYNVSKYLYEHF